MINFPEDQELFDCENSQKAIGEKACFSQELLNCLKRMVNREKFESVDGRLHDGVCDYKRGFEDGYSEAKSNAELFDGIESILVELEAVKVERDKLKERLDGGERVCIDKTKKTASYFYFPTNSWQKTNATLIRDQINK